ncbi:hypothetical protein PAAG_12303 [Paracoccidioides lutzii Pb01]|uniref:Uncharacterized protein n=1 Tax=Paracoccidioides lutzii (strain ATCC MYA-826 / Pb01) TaxID=502779 RepID=A0A0A2V4A8_PARBA|nr:hypothetical protein PAAG_12303 [Paracoccidioides lutzii Pb01]KGQ00995.1 hypothetical protein PAAG_12303 [Paracoccidioides lutzii Pb01]
MREDYLSTEQFDVAEGQLWLDLYCELDHVQMENRTYLSQAREMMEQEIERLRMLSHEQLKGFRRLLLSLTEVQFRQGYYLDAEILVRELVVIYIATDLQELDIVDWLEHVRTLIVFARLSSPPQD